jgi:hypothetical protein
MKFSNTAIAFATILPTVLSLPANVFPRQTGQPFKPSTCGAVSFSSPATQTFVLTKPNSKLVSQTDTLKIAQPAT